MDAPTLLRSARTEVLLRASGDLDALARHYAASAELDDDDWVQYRERLASFNILVPALGVSDWLIETDSPDSEFAEPTSLALYWRGTDFAVDAQALLRDPAMRSLFADFEGLLIRASLAPELLGTESVRLLRSVLLHSAGLAAATRPSGWNPPGICALRLSTWIGRSLGPLDTWARDAHVGGLLDQIPGAQEAGTPFTNLTWVSEGVGGAFAAGLDVVVAGTLKRIWRRLRGGGDDEPPPPEGPGPA